MSDLGRAEIAWPGEDVAVPVEAPSPRVRRWLRPGLVAAWGLVFVTGGIAVASTWNRFLEGLVQAPVPAGGTASVSDATPGERAVSEARQLLDNGRANEALSALGRIRPEEPVYPFSLQLRDEALRALAQRGPESR